MRPVLKATVWALALLAVLGAILWFIPTGYVVIAPGITGDLATMVKVQGGHPPRPGRLLMVAITLARANELTYLASRIDPNVELLKQSVALGGMNMNQYVRLNASMMQQSQQAAEVAGERLAGLPAGMKVVPGALVAAVLKTGSAFGKIEPGDRIVAVGPHSVTTPASVRAALARYYTVGEIVPITVIRKGDRVVIPVKTMRLAGDPAPGLGVGVIPQLHPVIPRKVTIASGQIGGPSAGLMFALEIYSQITGKNLAGGRIVAGTGEILPSGQVGPIGGVAQKVITVHRAGATVFLCPVANYPKALRTARARGYHMRIFPVATVAQALHDLEGLG